MRHSLPGSGATVDETYVARPDSVRFAARTPEGAVAVLARVLGQRVLAVEAGRSWVRLCRELGDRAGAAGPPAAT